MPHWLLVNRDDRYWFVGPFETADAAVSWATTHNPSDDPRWQVLGCPTPRCPPLVFSPVSAAAMPEHYVPHTESHTLSNSYIREEMNKILLHARRGKPWAATDIACAVLDALERKP